MNQLNIILLNII